MAMSFWKPQPNVGFTAGPEVGPKGPFSQQLLPGLLLANVRGMSFNGLEVVFIQLPSAISQKRPFFFEVPGYCL